MQKNHVCTSVREFGLIWEQVFLLLIGGSLLQVLVLRWNSAGELGINLPATTRIIIDPEDMYEKCCRPFAI